MSLHLAAIWGLFAAVLIAIYLMLYSKEGHAQSVECWPEMKAVHSSMEDVQRIRVEEEDQTKVLKAILAELKRKK